MGLLLLLVLDLAYWVPEIFSLENAEANKHKMTSKKESLKANETVEMEYHQYLRLVSCWVNSLSSKPESLSEDKVPGTSSETILDNLSAESANFLKACKNITLNDWNQPQTHP